MSIRDDIATFLAESRDGAYQAFQSKLIPSIPADSVIGVRTPALRKFAKQLAKRDDVGEFLNEVPHGCFEENQLHAFIVSAETDYERLLVGIDDFLPFVDNWATCDQMSPRGLAQKPEVTLKHVRQWMASGHPYTVRYGIGVLLQLFLDDRFRPEFLEWVARVESDEYYVNMMRAWFFAEALAKQPGATLPVIEEGRLDRWTNNKAIQKARESYRISPKLKEQLRGLRRTSQGKP
ncbi:DNA alkylation repair protein [uncultured Adlercreutzia sp.]|uniref:DNA alkylation repair protein n=1 Tax=uncultured Adlercreutzia sp. TaxID=875803 RepID=UPI0026F38C82|nr:DNA alkylation repair protein [uncultured Adlercreutzia sp.]